MGACAYIQGSLVSIGAERRGHFVAYTRQNSVGKHVGGHTVTDVILIDISSTKLGMLPQAKNCDFSHITVTITVGSHLSEHGRTNGCLDNW